MSGVPRRARAVPVSETRKVIQISLPIHKRLTEIKTEREQQLSRQVSFTEVIEQLLDRAGCGMNCTSCHAPVIWGRTASGRPIPLDPDPVETGNLAVRPPGAQVRYLSKSDALEASEWRAVSHFATCPNASLHRKSGAA